MRNAIPSSAADLRAILAKALQVPGGCHTPFKYTHLRTALDSQHSHLPSSLLLNVAFLLGSPLLLNATLSAGAQWTSIHPRFLSTRCRPVPSELKPALFDLRMADENAAVRACVGAHNEEIDFWPRPHHVPEDGPKIKVAARAYREKYA